MSAIKDIPWNMKPKNGVRSFMTEETFQQWIGLESHQTRMNERLKRFGISLSSEVPSGPWFPSVTKSDDRNKAGTSKESIHISAENIDMTSDRKTELVSAITDVCMSNTNVTSRSRTDKKDNLANLVKIEKTKSKVKHEIHESRIDQNESLNSSKIKYDSNLSISNQKSSNPPCSRMDMIGLEESTGEKHGNKKPDSLVQDDHGMKHTEFQDHHGKEHTDKAEMDQNEVLELIPPISFYRDSSEVAGEDKQTEGVMDVENTGTNIDMVHVTSHIDLHGDRKDGHVQDSAGCQVALDRTADLTRDKPKHISAVNAQGDSIAEVDRKARQGQAFIELADPNNPTESEKRAMKQIMIADKMFYNIKDRSTEKYVPLVYTKRPRNRFSKLTCHEHKAYLDLYRRFGNISSLNKEVLNDADFKRYAKMKEQVDREQKLYQDYLKSISVACKNDYLYVHPEVDKYIAARQLVKRKEILSYPRFYDYIDRVFLSEDRPDKAVTLQYVRPLLELGRVNKLVLPVMMPGMPQPCITTSFKRINELSPVVKGIYKGTVWNVFNKVVCSQDMNAEQLAVPNKCDVVMSSSAIKNLVDSQGKYIKFWDMPVTVREYKIQEADKTITHKIVFIDKPVIRPSQYIPKDRIQLYQKYAIRASSSRPNVRGHVFSAIKPSHELVKMPRLEEIEQELTEYDKTLQGSANKAPIYEDSEDNTEDQKTTIKEKENKGKKHVKSQIGVFDVEQDIDDLESFGMEMNFKTSVKVGGNKDKTVEEHNKDSKISQKHDPGTADVDTTDNQQEHLSNKKRKGKKSADDDLEFLKNELQGIKTRAIRESYKHADIYRDASLVGKEKTELPHTQDSKDMDRSEDHEINNKLNNSNFASEEKTGVSGIKSCDVQTVNEPTDESDKALSDNITDSGRALRTKSILSVKSISSLSDKMKQMSKIQSKLEQRDKVQQVVLSDYTLEKLQATAVRTTRSSSHSDDSLVSLGNDNKRSSLSNQSSESGKGTGAEKSEAGMAEVTVVNDNNDEMAVDKAFDSDSESEGLVIDLPSHSFDSSNTANTGQTKVLDMKSKNTVEDDMPQLSREVLNNGAKKDWSSPSVSQKDYLEPPVLSDMEMDSPHLVIADAEMESPVLNIRQVKTRSSSNCSVGMNSPQQSIVENKMDPPNSTTRGFKRSSTSLVLEETESQKLGVEHIKSDCHLPNTRGVKRRSTNSLSEELLLPKRSLRSSGSIEPVADCPGNACRGKRSEENEKTKMDEENEGITEDTGMDVSCGENRPTGHGRGRKAKSSASRSRSVSLESETCQVSARRVTRNSLGSHDTVLVKTEPEEGAVSVKRKRGRPTKLSSAHSQNTEQAAVCPKGRIVKFDDMSEDKTTVNNKQDCTDNLQDVNKSEDLGGNSISNKEYDIDKECDFERNLSDKKISQGENMIDNDDNSHQENNVESDKVVNADSVDADDIICKSPRKRTKRLVIDSDSEEDNSEELNRKGRKLHKGGNSSKKNEHKREHEGIEARKIKEMADAMKKRIKENAKTNTNSEHNECETRPVKSIEKNSTVESTDCPERLPTQSSHNPSSAMRNPELKTSIQEKTAEPLKAPTVESTCERGGLEHILSSQSSLLDQNRYKGSDPAEFISRHGMSQCCFPVEDNVTYHQWSLAGINILIRCKYHGFISGQGLVHIAPKLEYQPNFGFEQDTINETARNWISIYVRPNSSLLKVRINPFNSEIMMLDSVGYQDLIPPDSPFSQSKAFTDLHDILAKLKSLPVGQYLLKNNPKKEMLSVYRATNKDSGDYDLHLQSASFMKFASPNPLQWTPLNTRMMLPHQRKMNFIPCTYQPKDAVVPEKKWKPNNQKKKKNKNKKNKKEKS